MIRWSAITTGAVLVVGAAFVAGSSVPPAPPPPGVGLGKPELVKATIIGQKTGYFNMAAVMRGYKRANVATEKLIERRNRMTGNLMGLRGMYIELQRSLQNEAGKPGTNAKRQEEMARDLVTVTRRIEDMDREINKLLNNKATDIITELYDEVRATVVVMAREHGLSAMLAYPDAVTLEEANNPLIKELKLKPPAAMPFYLDPSVDYTEELLERLNAKFAAGDGGK